jgi:hypothetical protein
MDVLDKAQGEEKLPTMEESGFPVVEESERFRWKWRYIITAITGILVLIFLSFYYSGYGKDIDQWIGGLGTDFLFFILFGFIAQMIDGALGMAYGASCSTLLLSFGITPAAASASIHAAEVFTSGASGLMHLKFKNVNIKLFKTLLLPGIL